MIIDCHSHIYESSTPKGSKKSGHFGTTASEFTAEDMIKTMDENNVDMRFYSLHFNLHIIFYSR